MYAERYLGFNPTRTQRQEESRMQLSWIKVANLWVEIDGILFTQDQENFR